jgi:hypothetical protein
MEKSQQLKTLRIVRSIALSILLLLSVLVLIFSLLSGSEAYGGGFSGVMKNSPNSLPWLLFLVLVIISYKKSVLGGFLIMIFGAIITYFFNFTGGNFFLTTFIVCLLIVFLGLLVLFSGLTIKNLTAEEKE